MKGEEHYSLETTLQCGPKTPMNPE